MRVGNGLGGFGVGCLFGLWLDLVLPRVMEGSLLGLAGLIVFFFFVKFGHLAVCLVV